MPTNKLNSTLHKLPPLSTYAQTYTLGCVSIHFPDDNVSEPHTRLRRFSPKLNSRVTEDKPSQENCNTTVNVIRNNK